MARTNTTRPVQAAGEAARLHSPAAALQAVTAHHPFFPVGASGSSGHLFAVQAGVPLHDALDNLTMLIGAAQHSATDVAACVDRDGDASGTWVPIHLLTLALALTQSIHQGLNDAQSDPSGRPCTSVASAIKGVPHG